MDHESLCRAISTAQTAVDVQDPGWGERFADALAEAGWFIVPKATITDLVNATAELVTVVKSKR